MNLEKCTVKELRKQAQALAIKNRSKMRKAELISALKAAQTAHASDPAPIPEQLTSPSSRMLQEQKQQQREQFPNGDPGLPIPERYEEDILQLMVRDPQHVYAYWEISSATLEKLRTEHGPMNDAVLILETNTGTEMRVVDLTTNNYFLTVPENAEYRVRLAVRDKGNEVHNFMESSPANTPSAQPQTHNSDEHQWMAVDETGTINDRDFHELVDSAGLPGGPNSASLQKRPHTWVGDAFNLPSSHSFSSSLLSSASLTRQES